MKWLERVTAPGRVKLMPFALVAVTVLIIGGIELGHPYFFLQDDNRSHYLPLFVHNLRAVAGGELPLFNFHQYLGTPVAIQAAAFYPLNYLALGLSRLVLGHYFGAMEFIALFHLVIAVLGAYFLLRRFRLHEASCCFGALAWAFCGFVMAVGNSWIHVLGYAAYLPWILLFSARQIFRPDFRGVAILVALRVLDLSLGYPQLFVCTLTFDLLTVIPLYFIARRRGGSPGFSPADFPAPPTFSRFLLRYCLNLACVFAIALPLVLPALHQATLTGDRSAVLPWNEYAGLSYRLSHWLNGLVAPLSDMDHNLWSNQHYISHIGYLTLLFVIVAVVSVRRRDTGPSIILFALLAAFSLMWASDLVLTRIFYHLPIYNRFRWPFKLAFFTSFYLTMLSAFGFDIFLKKLMAVKWRGRNWTTPAVAVLLAAHAASFLLFYALPPERVFSRFLDPVPFEESLRDVLVNGRIVSVGLDAAREGERLNFGYSVPSLGFNYATLWGLDHFAGYEALVLEKNRKAALDLDYRSVFIVDPGVPLNIPVDTPLDYFRMWGVRWYVVDRRIPLVNTGAFRLAYSDRFRNVLYDPAAKPYVYWSDGPLNVGVRWRFTTNSIEVATGKRDDGQLIVNVLQNPFFSASIDGKGVPLSETTDGQIFLSVPGGDHRIVVTYSDPYFRYGAMISLACVALLALCGVVMRRGRKDDAVDA